MAGRYLHDRTTSKINWSCFSPALFSKKALCTNPSIPTTKSTLRLFSDPAKSNIGFGVVSGSGNLVTSQPSLASACGTLMNFGSILGTACNAISGSPRLGMPDLEADTAAPLDHAAVSKNAPSATFAVNSFPLYIPATLNAISVPNRTQAQFSCQLSLRRKTPDIELNLPSLRPAVTPWKTIAVLTLWFSMSRFDFSSRPVYRCQRAIFPSAPSVS